MATFDPRLWLASIALGTLYGVILYWLFRALEALLS